MKAGARRKVTSYILGALIAIILITIFPTTQAAAATTEEDDYSVIYKNAKNCTKKVGTKNIKGKMYNLGQIYVTESNYASLDYNSRISALSEGADYFVDFLVKKIADKYDGYTLSNSKKGKTISIGNFTNLTSDLKKKKKNGEKCTVCLYNKVTLKKNDKVVKTIPFFIKYQIVVDDIVINNTSWIKSSITEPLSYDWFRLYNGYRLDYFDKIIYFDIIDDMYNLSWCSKVAKDTLKAGTNYSYKSGNKAVKGKLYDLGTITYNKDAYNRDIVPTRCNNLFVKTTILDFALVNQEIKKYPQQMKKLEVDLSDTTTLTNMISWGSSLSVECEELNSEEERNVGDKFDVIFWSSFEINTGKGMKEINYFYKITIEIV